MREKLTGDQIKQIKAQLQTIIDSPRFAAKTTLPSLLRYVVEHTLIGKPIKEISIAQDVLDRPNFTGGEDESIVRSHVSKLRAVLADYYQKEGRLDSWLIQILPGKGYVASFEFRESPIAKNAPPKNLPDESEQELQQFALTGRVPAAEIPEIVRLIQEVLRKYSGRLTLDVDYGRTGSVIVYFTCSRKEYERIENSWRSGELSNALGFFVELIGAAAELDAELRATHSKALQNCFSMPIDVSEIDEWLVLDVDNDLVPSTALTAEVYFSADATAWKRVSLHSMDLGKPVPQKLLPTPFRPHHAHEGITPELAYADQFKHIKFIRCFFTVEYFGQAPSQDAVALYLQRSVEGLALRAERLPLPEPHDRTSESQSRRHFT